MHHALYLVGSTGYHALCEKSVRKKQRVNERCSLLRGSPWLHWLALIYSIAPMRLAWWSSRVFMTSKTRTGKHENLRGRGFLDDPFLYVIDPAATNIFWRSLKAIKSFKMWNAKNKNTEKTGSRFPFPWIALLWTREKTYKSKACFPASLFPDSLP